MTITNSTSLVNAWFRFFMKFGHDEIEEQNLIGILTKSLSFLEIIGLDEFIGC